jgi:hypothetical protein
VTTLDQALGQLIGMGLHTAEFWGYEISGESNTILSVTFEQLFNFINIKEVKSG